MHAGVCAWAHTYEAQKDICPSFFQGSPPCSLETRSLTELKAYCFGLAGWPANSQGTACHLAGCGFELGFSGLHASFLTHSKPFPSFPNSVSMS